MKGTIKIEFEGDNCLNCPFCRYNTTFRDFSCIIPNKHDKYRIIQNGVEYSSELGPRPDWCPIMVENAIIDYE